MPVIKLETFVKAPIELVFDLSRSIDLHVRTQVEHKERAIAGITSGLIGPGEIVTWEAVHFGVRQRLTSKITEFEPPYRFVDEMVHGTFKSFHHLHQFIPTEDGTKMIDVFDYSSPFGLLGVLADKLFLERYMFKLLFARNELIKREAEEMIG